MKAYLIAAISLHLLSLLTIVYRVGKGMYPHTRTTSLGEAVFIAWPLTVGFILWEAWLLFGGSP